MQVIIIGAGTGGLALAHALKQAGIGVTVYERDRTPRDARGGYRVGISPGGSRALRECIPPALFELFIATCARSPRYFNMLTEQLSELLCLQLTEEAADPVTGEKNVVREILRQVLLTGLDDIVCFDKKFVRYEDNPDGSLRAHFEDGTSSIGDVLIGADGVGSRVRKQRLPYARHEDTGILSIGGKLALTSETKALLSEKMFYGMSLIMAPKGFGGIIHVLEFPWNRGGGARHSAVSTGDGVVLGEGLVDGCPEDSIGWGLWASHTQFPKDPTHLEGPELARIALDMTAHWHPNFQTLIKLTDPASVTSINVRTSVPVSPWESSNVTLLGDAIHTMTPGRGAGANTALRDAALLRKTLIEVSEGRKPLAAAIHEYEVEMLRYSSEAVLESRKQMNDQDMIHKPVLGRLQLALMRTAMRSLNTIPPLKRRVIRSIMRVRAAN